MKNHSFFLFLILVFCFGCIADKIKVEPNDIVIKNVNIVDVKTGIINNGMTTLIRGNTIFAIGRLDDFQLSGLGNAIDGNNKYLIPGLWDMHTHLFNESDIRNASYPLLIANGITGIRVMAADCLNPPCEDPNMTIAQHRQLQEEITKRQLLGPKSILASDYINGSLQGESTILKPRTEEHGRALARLLKERGVDFIKIYDVLTPEAYYGITDEATNIQLDFAGHVPLTLSASKASTAGQKSIEHMYSVLLECSDLEDEMRKRFIELFTDNQGNINYTSAKSANDLLLQVVKHYSPSKGKQLFQTLRKNNTWFVPTIYHVELYYPDAEDWKKSPNIKYMPKEEYDYFVNDYEPEMRALQSPYHSEVEEMRIHLIKEARNEGVGILAGSDVGEVGLVHGFSLHKELVSLQKTGLSPLEVLQTATINPVKYQNAMDSLGTIEKGKIADLVLLNANPLNTIANTQNIDAVITNGVLLDRKDLDSILLRVETYIKKGF